MVKIITFEGTDYSGKSSIHNYLATKTMNGGVFNTGPIYPNDITRKLIADAATASEAEREVLYSMVFATDKAAAPVTDKRVVVQDRYWPSVVAYGKFLNKDLSLHHNHDLRRLFIQPDLAFVFYCSHDEMVRRSRLRERKSPIDQQLLEHPAALDRLLCLFEAAVDGIPNVHRIDTTSKTLDEVATEVRTLARSSSFDL